MSGQCNYSFNYCGLFRTENSVAGVAEAGDDVAVFVKVRVFAADEDVYVGMFCVDLFNSFGRADDAHKLNVLAAFRLNEVDCRDCAAASCEHRIENDDFAVCDIVGKFAVVLLGFKRFVVAIKTDVSDFCGGDKSKDTVYHAKTCHLQ